MEQASRAAGILGGWEARVQAPLWSVPSGRSAVETSACPLLPSPTCPACRLLTLGCVSFPIATSSSLFSAPLTPTQIPDPRDLPQPLTPVLSKSLLQRPSFQVPSMLRFPADSNLGSTASSLLGPTGGLWETFGSVYAEGGEVAAEPGGLSWGMRPGPSPIVLASFHFYLPATGQMWTTITCAYLNSSAPCCPLSSPSPTLPSSPCSQWPVAQWLVSTH